MRITKVWGKWAMGISILMLTSVAFAGGKHHDDKDGHHYHEECDKPVPCDKCPEQRSCGTFDWEGPDLDSHWTKSECHAVRKIAKKACSNLEKSIFKCRAKQLRLGSSLYVKICLADGGTKTECIEEFKTEFREALGDLRLDHFDNERETCDDFNADAKAFCNSL